MIIPPSPEEIYNQIISRARDEAGINISSPASVFGALARGFTNVHYSIWQDLAEADRASSIDRAIGIELDKIGEFLGVTRRKSEKATTSGYGAAVLFSNVGATSVPVIQGTAIFPTSDPSIIYRTVSSITVPAYSSATVDVEAIEAGLGYNVAAGALNGHNVGTSQLQVTNLRAIDSGVEGESDESYRARLYSSVQTKSSGSKIAIRQTLSQLPGVREAVIFEATAGAGTFDVLLVGAGGAVPEESITLAEVYLSEFAPVGVSYRVRIPKEIPVDVTVKLTLTPASESKRSSIINQIGQSIRANFEGLSVEDGSGIGEFVWTQLIERVRVSNSDIRDFTIDVTIKNKPMLLGSNYKPQVGERLIARRVRVE